MRTASPHFSTTSLVTDDAGAELLVDRLKLPFGTVSTSLNRLRDADPGWWVLGKLHAYRAQQGPFLHVDSDVFLWRALDRSLASADIVAQNPERAPVTDATFYKPTWFTSFVRDRGGWLPQEWERYVQGGGGSALCAGILGGRRVDFLHGYAEQAIALLESRRNHGIWRAMGESARLANSVLIEQYFLAACCEAYGHERTPLDVRCMFPSQDAARIPSEAARAGYTHLMEGKRAPDLTRLLGERVRRDYPLDYARCLRCVGWAAAP